MQDITQLNLESELINGSAAQPVLLDIWAPWCGPCKSLGPVLEKLETAYEGRFKLAKLNSDDEPEIAAQLSQMFGVRSIPFCVLFKGGQPVDGFVGALPEAEVRKFLDKHVAAADEESSDDELPTDDDDLLDESDTSSVIDKLQAAIATNPANDGVRYEYLRALLRAGRTEDARRAFDPVASKIMLDARLTAAGHWIAAQEAAPRSRPFDTLAAALAIDKRDFDARFELAQRYFAAGEFTQAMDELLEILMRDKGWRDELARKTYVAVLEVMSQAAPAGAKADAAAPQKGTLEVAGRMATATSNPVVDSYRRKLSMVLF